MARGWFSVRKQGHRGAEARQYLNRRPSRHTWERRWIRWYWSRWGRTLRESETIIYKRRVSLKLDMTGINYQQILFATFFALAGLACSWHGIFGKDFRFALLGSHKLGLV